MRPGLCQYQSIAVGNGGIGQRESVGPVRPVGIGEATEKGQHKLGRQLGNSK